MRISILQTLLELLYPERCSGCKRFGTALCTPCALSLPLAAPLKEEYDFAVFDYGNTIVRRAMWEFKYYHHASRARRLTHVAIPHIISFLAEHIQSIAPQTISLVPIPQHRTKTYSRGYNQTLILAKWLHASIPGTSIQQVLSKAVPSLPQAKTKNKQARKHNVAHTMRTTYSLDPKTIYIIVDDVTTTGATLNEARRALQQGGGKKILSVSIAHGYISS